MTDTFVTVTKQPAYVRGRLVRRIVIKISGEALGGASGEKLDEAECLRIAAEIIETMKYFDIEVIIVVGAGNWWRGALATGMSRVEADYIGMNMTNANAAALRSFFKQLGCPVRVHTALETDQLAEPYRRLRALHQLGKGHVVILGGGLGIPYLTTDTTAIVRAGELEADIVLMAKNGVGGIFPKNPDIHPGQQMIEEITVAEALANPEIRIMDPAALMLSKPEDVNVPIQVYSGNTPGELRQVLSGETVGTLVLPAAA